MNNTGLIRKQTNPGIFHKNVEILKCGVINHENKRFGKS